MDNLNFLSAISTVTTSVSNQTAQLNQDVRMNSLFRRSNEYQTYPQEGEDIGLYGGLIVVLLVICIFFIRKLQSS